MQLLRSLIFTGLFFLVTTLYAVGVLLCCWIPHPRIYFFAQSWATSLLWLLKVICGLDYRVTGKENLPSGAHVAMWKHSSTWETIAQAIIFPPQAWVLKRELMWIPVVGWALHFMRPIAVKRGAGTTAVNQVINQGKRCLSKGLWILIFPEGTRVPAGETKKYGVSGALLASRVGCKVIPVAHNAGVFWPRRGWLKKPGVIDVIIGPAIDGDGRDPRAINDEVREWIETTLSKLPTAVSVTKSV
jgi:1-acyl-sn-glycerol-3-phosphate acyltransferase